MRATNHQFNPTNDLSLLGFTVTGNMRLCVDMCTMDGILVSKFETVLLLRTLITRLI